MEPSSTMMGDNGEDDGVSTGGLDGDGSVLGANGLSDGTSTGLKVVFDVGKPDGSETGDTNGTGTGATDTDVGPEVGAETGEDDGSTTTAGPTVISVGAFVVGSEVGRGSGDLVGCFTGFSVGYGL
jgi:hypothetical protein